MDPYAIFNSVNSNYVHFRRMHQFDAHKLYKFVDIQPTNHSSYGPGYMAYVTDHLNVKYKVQLPGKYLRQLILPDHINFYMKDIQQKRNPFLIFRRQLSDNSYVIEIRKFDSELMQMFIKNLSVPENPLLPAVQKNDVQDDKHGPTLEQVSEGGKETTMGKRTHEEDGEDDSTDPDPKSLKMS